MLCLYWARLSLHWLYIELDWVCIELDWVFTDSMWSYIESILVWISAASRTRGPWSASRTTTAAPCFLQYWLYIELHWVWSTLNLAILSHIELTKIKKIKIEGSRVCGAPAVGRRCGPWSHIVFVISLYWLYIELHYSYKLSCIESNWVYIELCWVILSYVEATLSYVESVLSYVESTLSYVESTLSYVRTMLSYVESKLSYFESILS
jgi:hypothetical protein